MFGHSSCAYGCEITRHIRAWSGMSGIRKEKCILSNLHLNMEGFSSFFCIYFDIAHYSTYIRIAGFYGSKRMGYSFVYKYTVWALEIWSQRMCIVDKGIWIQSSFVCVNLFSIRSGCLNQQVYDKSNYRILSFWVHLRPINEGRVGYKANWLENRKK